MVENSGVQGVIPVLNTPFDDDDQIDFSTLQNSVAWAISHGVDGLATGMVSEFLKLSSTEKVQLGRVICDAAKGTSATIVLSCGAESTYETAKLAYECEQAGASAVMVNPPISMRLADDQLLNYYTHVFRATSIPVIVQDASGYVGQPISTNVLIDLYNQYPNRIYFKPEATPIGQRVSTLRDATQGLGKIFEGTGGAHLVDTFQRGVIGTMPGADLPWLFTSLWNALEDGNWKKINAINGVVSNLVSLMSSLDSYITIEKYFLVKQNVYPNMNIRGPVTFELDYETRRELDRLFEICLEVVKL
jgi:4-hydroxy-tetrahydrodipicolinate synthase